MPLVMAHIFLHYGRSMAAGSTYINMANRKKIEKWNSHVLVSNEKFEANWIYLIEHTVFFKEPKNVNNDDEEIEENEDE